MAENLSNDFETTLNGGINDIVTTLVVTSATGAPEANFRIRIDDEIMMVTAKAGTTWTVTRGLEDTTPAAHANLAPLAHVMTLGGLTQYLREHAKVLSEVESGDEATIASGEQWTVRNEIRIVGSLRVAGELVIV